MPVAVRYLGLEQPDEVLKEARELYAVEPAPENDLYLRLFIDAKIDNGLTVYRPRWETAQYVRLDGLNVTEAFDPATKPVDPEIIAAIRTLYETRSAALGCGRQGCRIALS